MKNIVLEAAIAEARLGKEANLEKAQALLIDHLKIHPYDTEAWLLLIRVECNSPFDDADRIREFSERVLSYDSGNPYALLFLSYADHYLRGNIDDDIYLKLVKAKSENLELLSMIEVAKSWYFESRNPEKCEEALRLSIEYCSFHTINFCTLGELYLEQGKQNEGRALIKRGLNNIKRVITSESNDPYDPTNFSNFLAEFFAGTTINFVQYEILQDLIS